MPKMKSDSGAKRRFKVTGSGKIVRGKAFRSHKLEGKSASRRRRLGREVVLKGGNEKRIKRLLGMR